MAQDDEFRLEDLAIELASTHEETQNSFNAEIEKIARALGLLRQNVVTDNSDQIIEVTLNAIENSIEIVKTRLDQYQANVDLSVGKQLSGIKSQFSSLLSELEERKILIENLNNRNGDQVAERLIKNINNQLGIVLSLQDKINRLEKEKTSSSNQIDKLEEENDKFRIENQELNKNLALAQGELNIYNNRAWKLGLSAGVSVNSKEYEYIVNNDSTVNELEISGPGGIISAVLVFQPETFFGNQGNNKLQFILNVPIAEVGLGGDNSTVSSIFNRNVSLGLGVGYELTNYVSVGTLFNFSRIQRIDSNSLNTRNNSKLWTQEPFSKLDLDEVTTTSEANVSMTIGLVIKLSK